VSPNAERAERVRHAFRERALWIALQNAERVHAPACAAGYGRHGNACTEARARARASAIANREGGAK
jgi:hypothetical protein